MRQNCFEKLISMESRLFLRYPNDNVRTTEQENVMKSLFNQFRINQFFFLSIKCF